jgi:hypothetical protein
MSVITKTAIDAAAEPSPQQQQRRRRRRGCFAIRHRARVLALLEGLCQLLTALSTVTSQFYYGWNRPGSSAATKYCGLFYRPCYTQESYLSRVRSASQRVYTGVHFAESFVIAAALSSAVAFVLYLVLLLAPWRKRAWAFVATAHAASALFLLLELVTCTAILHDLRFVLEYPSSYDYYYQRVTLTLAWGFAFNLLAWLAHALQALVLAFSVSATTESGSGRSSAQGASREPLLTLEQGEEGKGWKA